MATDDSGDVEPAGGETDPFEGLTLDEDFVRGADIVEESAEARLARMARIDAERRRIEAEREVQRAALDKQLRRQARREARTGGRAQRLLVVVVMLGVFVGLAYWNTRNQDGSRLALGSGGLFAGDVSGAVVNSDDRPPAGVEEQAEPLGTPAPLAVESGAYRFIQTQPASDRPIAYDPCRPIHVVVNDARAIPGGDLLLQQALDQASRATGLQFVVDGLTDEAPSDDRDAYQPDRYPGRWAPVLVAWSDPQESPRLAGDVAGVGGSAALLDGDAAVFVTGSIELDGPGLAGVAARPDGQAQVRAVIEHELAHVLGLDHVADPTQLMNPETSGSVTAYQAGDLTGLAKLGQGACFPDV